MTAIGETLRRERLKRNLDLETISRELKISPKILSAIEEEKFDRLPGGVFAKSFVRQYARLLGLDEEEMGNEVQRILQPEPEISQLSASEKPAAVPIQLPRLKAWETVGDSRFTWSSPLPALALVVVVMMGCAGVYSWWQRTRHPAQVRDSAAARVAAQQQPPPQAAPVQPPAGQTEIPPAPTAETAAADRVAPGAALKPPESLSAAEPGTVVKQLPALPAASSNPNAPVRVELVADEPVWVLARTDGKYLFSGTLEAKQTRTVEANSTVLLRLGNAGGVNITLNGKSLGAVGPKGQVRTVQLTSGGFEIVAVPKAPSVPLDPL
jgi:cytoskeleton protein RodZ